MAGEICGRACNLSGRVCDARGGDADFRPGHRMRIKGRDSLRDLCDYFALFAFRESLLNRKERKEGAKGAKGNHVFVRPDFNP